MSTLPKLAGSLNKYGFAQADNVWDTSGISPTIITGGSQIGHQINIMEKCELMGNLDSPKFNEMTSRVYGTDGLSPSIRTYCGGYHEAKIVVSLVGGFGEKKSNGGTQWYEQDRVYDSEGIATSIPAESSFHPYYLEEKEMPELRIRKLTEGECMRLMGFEEKDTLACKEKGLSKANIYHQSGDSIVTTVLAGIFGELLGIDYQSKIEAHCDKLHGETL